MAVKKTYRINLRNYGSPPAVMVSQYDEGYAIAFEIFDGPLPVLASSLSGYTFKLKGRQPGNLPFLAYEFEGTLATALNAVVSFEIDTTMTARAGKGTAELVILDEENDVKFASVNFAVYTEPAAVPDGSIDADVQRAMEIAEEVQEIVDTAAAEVKGEAEAWAVGQRDGEDVPSTDPTYENNAKYYAEQAQDIADSIGIDATLSISGKAADAKKTGDEISSLKEDLSYALLQNRIVVTGVEDGYYSINDGKKYPNSASSTYKRSSHLIPARERTLYVADSPCQACCYDSAGTFISAVYFDTATYKSKRKLTPAGTAYIGLFASGATGFVLTKIDGSDFTFAEYPYTGESYLHIEQCWCNGNGGAASVDNLDMLIIPNVTAGDKFYVSNNAGYNCICFDIDGNMLETTVISRNVLGKIYTIPTGAVQMYVNLYRNRTKGVNNEMIDYICKITKGKVLAIGDSITWLDGRQNYGGAAYFSGWQRQLRLAGYDVVNAGFSGYPYATGLDIVDSVDYSIFKEIVTKNYDVTGYDYIILFGGTNDVLYGGALGTRPSVYSNRTFDASTFNGAIGAIINYIRTNNLTAKILMASFQKSEAVSRVFLNAYTRVEEIRYNCDFWSCKYVDIFRDMNIQPTYDQFDQFFYDSTHPNFDGMQRIGKLMLDAIKAS